MALDPVRRKTWLVRLGYVSLALLSFAYFLYLGFPFERVLPRVLEAYKKELGGMRIEAGTVRAGWFLSLVATDVKVYGARARRGGPQEADEQPLVKLDRLAVRLKPLKLVTGKVGANVDAQLYAGRVRGSVVKSAAGAAVDLAAEGVEIAKYPVLAAWGANLSGQIGGTVKLSLDAADGTKTTGKIDLAVKNPRIEESVLIILKLPTTVFERGGAAVIDIKDGKATLTDVGLRGEDLELGVEGEIALKKRLPSSQWSAFSTIRANDAWKSKVAGFDAIVGAGKCADGSYRYRLAGVLGGFPRTAPDRSCR